MLDYAQYIDINDNWCSVTISFSPSQRRHFNILDPKNRPHDFVHWNMKKNSFNTLRPRQNGHRFTDTFKRIFLNENVRISIKISLRFVPKGPINNNPALVQIMAWRWSGDKPLSEPLMASLLTHICVTRPQWVKWLKTCIVEQILWDDKTFIKSSINSSNKYDWPG